MNVMPSPWPVDNLIPRAVKAMLSPQETRGPKGGTSAEDGRLLPPPRGTRVATAMRGHHLMEGRLPAFEQTSFAPGVIGPSCFGIGEEDARKALERRISAHLQTGRLALGITDNRFTMI